MVNGQLLIREMTGHPISIYVDDYYRRYPNDLANLSETLAPFFTFR